MRLFPGPAQNFVYADVDGHIGWYAAGRLPIRRAGDGARPYPGASTDGDWLGFVPFDELPHVFDPPSGRIVTANNRLVGTDYPYKVTRGGIGPWRAAALFEDLEAREGWTPTTSRASRASGCRFPTAISRTRCSRPRPATTATRPGTTSRARWGAGTDAWSRGAAPPRWPSSPSARSARA